MSPAVPGPGDPAGAAPHVHEWHGSSFAFDGAHPVAQRACACGAVRTIRAWEATWEPGGPPVPHPARGPLEARPLDEPGR